MNTQPWRGVFPAATTQFHHDGSLDLDGTALQLEVLIGSGVSGLVMLGSLGENLALSPAEKVEVMKTAIAISNGRVPVLSGVAETATATACSYAAHMERIGADGLMVLPAMVYKADEQETMAHYRAVAASSRLPIMVYNNPLAYGVDVTPAMLGELGEDPRFVAVKESAGDTRRLTDIFNELGDRYAVFAGVDDLIFECTALGAVGWVAGVGLAFPHENQYLWELMQAGRWNEARDLYRWFTPLMHLDIGNHFVQYIKLAMQETGLGREWVRLPRLPITGAERDRVLGVIREGIADRPSVPRHSA